MNLRHFGNPARYGILMLAALLLTSCATSKKTQTWVQDGKKAGTITTLKSPKGGCVVTYRNLSNQVVRTERRDSAHNLLPGACITVTDYDAVGRPEQFRFLDGAEKPATGTLGFSIHRFEYAIDQDQNPVVNERYLDTENKPVTLRAGYAALRRTKEPGGRLKKLELFDAFGAAAPSAWLGVTNVVRVEYAYLEGVGEVTCAVFFDPSGKVIARKQLSGAANAGSATYSGPAGGIYVPPPAYMPPPRPMAPPPRLGPR